MKCEKCDGRGWNDNQRYWNTAACIAYERGIEARKKCGKCKGTGYIIGNVKDVLDLLKVLKNNRQCCTDKEIQQCIDAIEKY